MVGKQMNGAAEKSSENSKKNEVTLTLDIKSLATLDKEVSATVKIGGLEWQIAAWQEKPDEPTTAAVVSSTSNSDGGNGHQQQQSAGTLKFRLTANEHVNDRLWWCQCKYTCYYKMGAQQRKHWKYLPFHSYNGGIEEIANLREEWDLKQFNGALKIDVVLEVMQSVYEGLPPLNTQITVNNEILAVNKYILYAYSPRLRHCFESWPKEKGTNVELLLDANADMEAFKAMVYGVHVFGGALVDKDLLDYKLAKNILSLSVKYEVDVWAHCCEQFLIHNSTGSDKKMELLELADRLKREKLKEFCLANLDPLEYLENNAQNEVICARLGKRTQVELKACLAESAKRMRLSLGTGNNRNRSAGETSGCNGAGAGK